MNGIANRWKAVPLGALAEFRNGVNYSKENFGRGIKVINVRDFQNHSTTAYDELEEINPEGVVRDESLLQNDDIVFVRSNGNRELIGRSLFITGLAERVTHSAFSIRARFTSDQTLPRFYAYVFRSSLIRQALSAQGNGTNISNLNQTILAQLQVPLPPISIQRKIAAILSVYDDLIENNTRRIKILEEMAQALYREWFVRFRFPEHESIRTVDSPLGPLPEGWEIRAIGELCKFVQRGVTPKYSDGSGLYIINQKANRGTSINIADLKELDPGLQVPEEKFARSGDLLVNSLGEGTLGRVHYFTGPQGVWAVDQHMTICRSSIQGVTAYLYMILSSEAGQARIQSLKTGGTNMTMLNISALREFGVIYPGTGLLSGYYEIIGPTIELKRQLETKNDNLRRTRDLLLPKLISGEARVEDLEISI